jgi:NAD(P)-dependent dehydrogenase (short-subunit alcohol dehydrogenase family)
MKQANTLLISGGGRGIGAATALLAAQHGYDICLIWRQDAVAAQDVVQRVRAMGRGALAVQADVSQEAEILAVFARIQEAGMQLAGLVNNAGMLERQMRVEEMDVARWQRVLAVNLLGTFICSREAVKRLSTKHGGPGGSIVNLSSVAARIGAPNEYVDYAAAKAAVDAFTLGLAKEVATEGIRVNAVRPGVIYTDIHASGGEPDRVQRVRQLVPMKRGGQPEEIAQAIVWLLSEQASYITGTLLDVSGGR